MKENPDNKFYRRKDGKRYLMRTHESGGIVVNLEGSTPQESQMELGSNTALLIRLANYEACTSKEFSEAREGQICMPSDVRTA